MKKLTFISMNLQLFAEDGGASGGAATPQETSTVTSTLTATPTESTTGATTETTATETKAATVTPSGEQTGGATVTETKPGETEPATQPKQTPEQDRAYADLRRKAEAAEKRATEIETQRQHDIEVAKKYGQYGIYSDADVAAKYGQSHGLKTVADFEAQLQREEYQAKGIDPDMINKIIAENPIIKRAQEAEQAAIKAQQDHFLVESFDELSKAFSWITKAEEVPADVWRAWNNGVSGITLKQAYAALNYDSIASKQAEAAKQATLNSIQSKEHVRGNGAGSEIDTTTIPDETLEYYKKFNPGKTLDEYKAHYKASQK